MRERMQAKHGRRSGRIEQRIAAAVGKLVGTRKVGPPAKSGIGMAFMQYEAEARRVCFAPPGQNGALLAQCRGGRGPVVHHDQRRQAIESAGQALGESDGAKERCRPATLPYLIDPPMPPFG